MAFEPENLGLSPAGLPLLRDLIHERTGLYYDNGRYDSFTDRLAPLVIERGFRSFLDFYYLLKYEERAPGDEWRRVMDALSVQETYFWREIAQIRGFVDSVLPVRVCVFCSTVRILPVVTAVPLGELPDDSAAWQHGVDELAAEDAEIGEYVHQLEEAKDTADLPEASGEAIAQEFERYLRRRDKGTGG